MTATISPISYILNLLSKSPEAQGNRMVSPQDAHNMGQINPFYRIYTGNACSVLSAAYLFHLPGV